MKNAASVPRILLDITPVTARPEGRTGLARVALSLGRALVARGDLSIRTCAWGSLAASEEFESVRRDFPALHGVQPSRSVWERFCVARSRRAAAVGGLRHAAWRIAGQVTNRLRDPLAGVDLASFDLAHSTYARFPRVVRRRRLPTVITVHDVMPLRLPAATFPPGQVGITRRILASIEPTDWVVCVSEWTKADFLAVCDHPGERTVVVPNGIDHETFHPDNAPTEVAGVRRRFGLGDRPYLLTLSSLAPHKNVGFLVDAWIKSGAAAQGARLVMAGGRTSDPGVVLEALGIDHLPAGIVVTGFITDEEFRALASGSQAFLFPSLYEGFGLPVLEAMACGAPVVASNRTSLPEVVGDCGTLLDPMDRDDWAAAIMSAAGAAIRGAAEPKSVSRAAAFSWHATAERYAALYRQVLA